MTGPAPSPALSMRSPPPCEWLQIRGLMGPQLLACASGQLWSSSGSLLSSAACRGSLKPSDTRSLTVMLPISSRRSPTCTLKMTLSPVLYGQQEASATQMHQQALNWFSVCRKYWHFSLGLPFVTALAAFLLYLIQQIPTLVSAARAVWL